MVKVGNLMKKSVRRICGACLLMICLVSLSGSERYSLITRMRADGWNLSGQEWSFWESGERQKGWLWLGKYWYYFDEKRQNGDRKKTNQRRELLFSRGRGDGDWLAKSKSQLALLCIKWAGSSRLAGIERKMVLLQSGRANDERLEAAG